MGDSTHQPKHSINEDIKNVEQEIGKNQCEKCKKGFASMTLLRYHYCSHFRTILKKRFANLYDDDKCLVCLKTFPNPGRLLLHIGINHDKINEILRMSMMKKLIRFQVTLSLTKMLRILPYLVVNEQILQQLIRCQQSLIVLTIKV